MTGTGGEQALRMLLEGNRRFIDERCENPNRTAQRRSEILSAQKPFAVVITCSDSRVPPEIIFDVGLGDLFVIRNAGNLIDDFVAGSCEYAVRHLGVPLVVVLGHTECGAVHAALSGGREDCKIQVVIDAIRPAVEEARRCGGDLYANAIRVNVERAVGQLAAEPGLRRAIDEGTLILTGALYDLESGIVEVI